MKRLFIAIGAAMIGGAVSYSPAAHAGPCAALLCMAGMPATGAGCSGPVGEFFSIQVWGFWGYEPGATAARRAAFLNSCSGAAANEAVVQRIIGTYGTLLAAP